ncbi:hypothetical protein [Pseudonocardia sp. Ae717_Ps2]|uniref:hypothetical protein n=1 Tax=Pseudonocardia sp. Ae717_Ps2 TaxID=1885573 RepID=UPI00094AE785|nr:hypothetical protein [Pseudonocardia sp. Ae717_Ps2]
MQSLTSSDVDRQVCQAAEASEGSYDVDGIVATIIDRHGCVDPDTLDPDVFWAIVLDQARD